MKRLTKFSIGFLSLLFILLIIAFLFPSKTTVSRSILIKSSPANVFNYVNDLHNWEKWSPWANVDSLMDIIYFGNEKGEGAGYEWKGDESNVGCGRILVTSSKPTDSIKLDIEFMNRSNANGLFSFLNTDSGVIVKWSFIIDLGNNPLNRYFGFFMDKSVGKDFEKGLKSLKEIAENQTNTNNNEVDQAKILAFEYMGIRETVKLSEMSEKMEAYFKELANYVNQNKLKAINSPFTIYHKFTETEADIETGIPIEKVDIGQGHIKPGKFSEAKVVFANYYGTYNNIASAHELIQKWLSANNKKMNGSPWEFYITNPSSEKDSAKWLTRVYYPIE